jgi:hypothetical protein
VVEQDGLLLTGMVEIDETCAEAPSHYHGHKSTERVSGTMFDGGQRFSWLTKQCCLCSV